MMVQNRILLIPLDYPTVKFYTDMETPPLKVDHCFYLIPVDFHLYPLVI